MAASPKRKSWLVMAAGILVSLACVGYIAWILVNDPQQWAQVKAAFRDADYRYLPPMWLALFVFYWLKAWRWRLLLSAVGRYRPLRDLFGPTMAGFAFNNVLPARIGEFIRCAMFSKQQNVPLAVTISSLVLERLFDMVAIVFYLALGLFLVKQLPPGVQEAALAAAAAAVLLVILSLAYVIWTKPIIALLEAILRRVPFLPAKLIEKVCRVLEGGAQGLAAIRDIRLVTAMLMISLVKWALNGFIMLLSLWAFQIPATAAHAMVLMGAVAFAVAIPAAPGFFGVIQAVYIEVGKLFGFAPPVMLAASIFYHLAQYIPVTATGLICFFWSGLKLNQVEPPAVNPQSTVTG